MLNQSSKFERSLASCVNKNLISIVYHSQLDDSSGIAFRTLNFASLSLPAENRRKASAPHTGRRKAALVPPAGGRRRSGEPSPRSWTASRRSSRPKRAETFDGTRLFLFLFLLFSILFFVLEGTTDPHKLIF